MWREAWVAAVLAVATAVDASDGKMRALLVGNAVLRGHVEPLLKIGAEMERRGFEVKIALQDDGLSWVMQHACSQGGPGKTCCETPWEIHGCAEIVSLGTLTSSHKEVKGVLARVLDQLSVLNIMWTMSRDLYINQAKNTLEQLCKFLSDQFPEKNVSWFEKSSSQDQEPYCTSKENQSYSDENEESCATHPRQHHTPWRPDIIVADIGAVGAVEAAEAFSIPIVLNSPTLLFTLEDTVPSSTRHIPGWGSGFSKTMTLFQRCINIVYPRLMAVALTPEFTHLNNLRARVQLPPYQSQHAIFQGKHIIVDTALGFDYPRSIDPFTEYVGPILDQQSILAAKFALGISSEQDDTELGDVDVWLDEQVAQHTKVIVMNFGSLGVMDAGLFGDMVRGSLGYSILWVASKEAGGEIVSGVVDIRAVMAYLRGQRKEIEDDVLRSYFYYCSHAEDKPTLKVPLCSNQFKVENDEQDIESVLEREDDLDWRQTQEQFPSQFFVYERPENVSLLSVVSHKAIKVQVSHCGLAAAQEAVLANNMLYCIPLYADQFDVAARVVDAGAGVSMDRRSVSPSEFGQVLDFLHGSKASAISDNVGRLGRYLLGTGGSHRAVEIIESVAKNGPQFNLRSKELDWPWYHSSLMDVYTFLFASSILAVTLLWYLLRFLARCFTLTIGRL